MDWNLYDIGLRHERVKIVYILGYTEYDKYKGYNIRNSKSDLSLHSFREV